MCDNTNMKTLKFEHQVAELIKCGNKTSTWRINDDKNISVNDEVKLIDKVDPKRPETWRAFGMARIEKVIEKRLGDITATDQEGHEKFNSAQDMLNTYKGYYDNNVTLSTPLKMIFFHYLPMDQSNDVVYTAERIDSVTVYADGGSRGNPGPSASGFVILEPNTNKVLVDKGVYLGITTNNQAEYLALKFALEEAKKMGVREVQIYMDSLLVVNQLNGIFKVRNRDLWPVHDAVKELLDCFGNTKVTHVPRELNKLADAAVNRALDEALGIEHPTNRL